MGVSPAIEFRNSTMGPDGAHSSRARQQGRSRRGTAHRFSGTAHQIEGSICWPGWRQERAAPGCCEVVLAEPESSRADRFSLRGSEFDLGCGEISRARSVVAVRTAGDASGGTIFCIGPYWMLRVRDPRFAASGFLFALLRWRDSDARW